MVDKKRRSLLKAITWRIGGVFVTFIVSYILTRNVLLAAGIGLIDSIIKIFAFYIHERVWNKIDYGRVKDEQKY